MKRLIAFLLCVLLSVSLLAGCGNQGGPEAASTAEEQKKDEPKSEETKKEEAKSPETVTISWFTESMDDTGLAIFKKYTLDPLAEKLPHIKIDHQPTADWNQALKIKMAAGEGPDFFNMDGPTVAAEYVAADRMMDLTFYVEKYGWDKIIFPWALNSCKVNGKVFSIPNSYEGLVLWYNADMFKSNNWEVPKTYADLEKISNESMGKGLMPFVFGSSDFKPANEWFFSVVLANYCGKDAMKKVLTGEAKWTDEPYKGAISLLAKMWQNGWISAKKSHSISGGDAQALFLQEKAPMKMEGTWLYGGLSNQQDMKFQYDMALFPSLKEGVNQALPLALGGCFGVSSNSKYPDQVAEVINSLYTNVEAHAKGVELGGAQTLPINIPDNLFTDQMNPVQKKMIKLLGDAQSSGNIGYCSWTFWPPETRNFMIDNIEKVFLNIMTVDEYLTGTQTLFDKEKAAGKLPVIP